MRPKVDSTGKNVRLDFLLQCFKRSQDQLAPERLLLVRRQLRIPRRADDSSGRNRAEGAYFLRHGNHGADLRHRYLELLDFFADRCAAASAGASSRGEDHPRNTCSSETLGYVATDVRCIFHRGMGSARGVNDFVKLADHAFAL